MCAHVLRTADNDNDNDNDNDIVIVSSTCVHMSYEQLIQIILIFITKNEQDFNHKVKAFFASKNCLLERKHVHHK